MEPPTRPCLAAAVSRRDQPWAILVAAGSGSRLADALGGHPKQFMLWKGVPLYWHSARTMSRSGAVCGIVFVFPQEALEEERARLCALADEEEPGIPWLAVAGGPTRQDSVRLGLEAVPADARLVLVHDAARPFVSAALVRRMADAVRDGAVAAVPCVPLTDTVKLASDDCTERVERTLPRERLRAVQTPQAFDARLLRQAHARAVNGAGEPDGSPMCVTDDASLLEAFGHPVRLVPGEASNSKITSPADLAMLTQAEPCAEPCSGFGYDVHRYGAGRPLRLGGVPIPNAPEVVAHSDGDVLLHALMDAILGCAGLGDIGRHFPDSDPALEGISSAILLGRVLELATAAGVRLCHADLTIIAQTPRLAPWREEIRATVASLLGLEKERVNVKATTEEGLGFTGRCEGIKACALVSALRHDSPGPVPCGAVSPQGLP